MTACRTIRERILKASHISGHGHIPTCFSIVEMLYGIYDTMKHDPQKPDWSQRDLFVLSKGHGSLAHYATLSYFNYFSVDELHTFGAYQSRLGCHADRLKVPGVEVSTGSLGHGIGVAVGMALAFKIQKSPRQVYVIIGDGEANEGTVWEALMVAVDQQLDNLTILLDYNQSQSRCLQISNPVERFNSFGCQTIDVDGHSVSAIKDTLNQPSQQVKALVCQTQKGFGCKTLLDDMFAWHRRSPKNEELKQLLEELHA